MIHLDTSLLIDALTGPRRAAPELRKAIEGGDRILLTTIVLYEWLRGPRLKAELAAQATLFPEASAVSFGHVEAALAAQLSRRVRSPRGREIDLAVAACAIAHGAALWTLNMRDFSDIPGLALYPA